MIAPPIPSNESERLAELYKYELLDSAYEVEFQEIVQLASKLCNVPMSLISLIDMNRQWFKARLGIDDQETERNVSFCGHAILSDGLFEVSDAMHDERFHDNPLVTGEPNIRYYAGMPLVTNNGYKLGTLCVLDRVPRQLEEEQSFAMKVLGNQIIKLFELRIRNKELKKVSDVQQRIMTIMAHDIRGPLSALESSMQLKNMGVLSDEDMKEIDAMLPLQLNSTITLLNNIVAWGKLQLSDNQVQTTSFSLRELVDECFGYYLLYAQSKKNELVNNVPADLVLDTNREGLEFALRNLIGNANKFTAAGTITLSVRQVGGAAEISVKDTGVGMSLKAQESMLQRTWTTLTTGTNKEKGSGMGLKLVYEYLASIKGDIRFASAPGEGTEAVVSIPQ